MCIRDSSSGCALGHYDLGIKEYAIVAMCIDKYFTESIWHDVVVVLTVSAIATMALFAAKMLGLNIAVTK